MPLRNTRHTWGSVAKGFHWLMAVLIVSLMVLGWTAVSWHLSPMKVKLFVWHKSFGVLVLTLAVLRLVWRLFSRPPALPAELPAVERRLARLGHIGLYVLMLAMPVSGWVVNSAADFPLKIFWLVPLPEIVTPDEAVQRIAESVHLTLFFALAALLLIHISAALRHHFINRNDVLARMLPGSRRTGARDFDS